MKKVYIVPSVETLMVNVNVNILVSMSGEGAGTEDIHFGGQGDGPGDVKGEAWTDIWE